ncbi:uncharacterized protein LOC126742869 isoform X2 [Anthonomus grandis grandis]|uniref:uncharacterized protein LOC126742869 isoform X2 n=1 Tax=Anthonomus grandis grandis TaxID=2921223 RepID=UPI002165BF96|nr:uncharacterized protein LOC126742869 isoform X2 [Anthonomus grandis grandis]
MNSTEDSVKVKSEPLEDEYKCVICDNTWHKTRSLDIGYHSFPRRKRRFSYWKSFCNYAVPSLIMDESVNIMLCSLHFNESDFWDDQGKRLKTGALPRYLLPLDLKDKIDEDIELPQNQIDKNTREDSILTNVENDNITNNQSSSDSESDNSSFSENESDNFKETTEIKLEVSCDTLPALTFNEKTCRLCLKQDFKLVPILSDIMDDNTSTLELAKVFQWLTGETREQVENPKVPSNMCEACIKLMMSAYDFRKKYDLSRQHLLRFLLSNFVMDADYDINYEANNDCSVYSLTQDRVKRGIDTFHISNIKFYDCSIRKESNSTVLGSIPDALNPEEKELTSSQGLLTFPSNFHTVKKTSKKNDKLPSKYIEHYHYEERSTESSEDQVDENEALTLTQNSSNSPLLKPYTTHIGNDDFTISTKSNVLDAVKSICNDIGKEDEELNFFQDLQMSPSSTLPKGHIDCHKWPFIESSEHIVESKELSLSQDLGTSSVRKLYSNNIENNDNAAPKQNENSTDINGFKSIYNDIRQETKEQHLSHDSQIMTHDDSQPNFIHASQSSLPAKCHTKELEVKKSENYSKNSQLDFREGFQTSLSAKYHCSDFQDHNYLISMKSNEDTVKENKKLNSIQVSQILQITKLYNENNVNNDNNIMRESGELKLAHIFLPPKSYMNHVTKDDHDTMKGKEGFDLVQYSKVSSFFKHPDFQISLSAEYCTADSEPPTESSKNLAKENEIFSSSPDSQIVPITKPYNESIANNNCNTMGVNGEAILAQDLQFSSLSKLDIKKLKNMEQYKDTTMKENQEHATQDLQSSLPSECSTKDLKVRDNVIPIDSSENIVNKNKKIKSTQNSELSKLYSVNNDCDMVGENSEAILDEYSLVSGFQKLDKENTEYDSATMKKINFIQGVLPTECQNKNLNHYDTPMLSSEETIKENENLNLTQDPQILEISKLDSKNIEQYDRTTQKENQEIYFTQVLQALLLTECHIKGSNDNAIPMESSEGIVKENEKLNSIQDSQISGDSENMEQYECAAVKKNHTSSHNAIQDLQASLPTECHIKELKNHDSIVYIDSCEHARNESQKLDSTKDIEYNDLDGVGENEKVDLPQASQVLTSLSTGHSENKEKDGRLGQLNFIQGFKIFRPAECHSTDLQKYNHIASMESSKDSVDENEKLDCIKMLQKSNLYNEKTDNSDCNTVRENEEVDLSHDSHVPLLHQLYSGYDSTNVDENPQPKFTKDLRSSGLITVERRENTVKENKKFNSVQDSHIPSSSKLDSNNIDNSGCNKMVKNEAINLIQDSYISPLSKFYTKNVENIDYAKIEKNEEFNLMQDLQFSSSTQYQSDNTKHYYFTIVEENKDLLTQDLRLSKNLEVNAVFSVDSNEDEEKAKKRRNWIRNPPFSPISKFYSENIGDDCNTMEENEKVDSAQFSQISTLSKLCSKVMKHFDRAAKEENQDLQFTQDLPMSINHIPANCYNKELVDHDATISVESIESSVKENEKLNSLQDTQISLTELCYNENSKNNDTFEENSSISSKRSNDVNNDGCNTMEENKVHFTQVRKLSPLLQLYSETMKKFNCNLVEKNEELNLIENLQTSPLTCKDFEHYDDVLPMENNEDTVKENDCDTVGENKEIYLTQNLQRSLPAERLSKDKKHVCVVPLQNNKDIVTENKELHLDQTSKQHKIDSKTMDNICAFPKESVTPTKCNSLHDKTKEMLEENESHLDQGIVTPHPLNSDSKNVKQFDCGEDTMGKNDEVGFAKNSPPLAPLIRYTKVIKQYNYAVSIESSTNIKDKKKDINLSQTHPSAKIKQESQVITKSEDHAKSKDTPEEIVELNLTQESQSVPSAEHYMNNTEYYGCVLSTATVEENEKLNFTQDSTSGNDHNKNTEGDRMGQNYELDSIEESQANSHSSPLAEHQDKNIECYDCGVFIENSKETLEENKEFNSEQGDRNIPSALLNLSDLLHIDIVEENEELDEENSKETLEESKELNSTQGQQNIPRALINISDLLHIDIVEENEELDNEKCKETLGESKELNSKQGQQNIPSALVNISDLLHIDIVEENEELHFNENLKFSPPHIRHSENIKHNHGAVLDLRQDIGYAVEESEVLDLTEDVDDTNEKNEVFDLTKDLEEERDLVEKNQVFDLTKDFEEERDLVGQNQVLDLTQDLEEERDLVGKNQVLDLTKDVNDIININRKRNVPKAEFRNKKKLEKRSIKRPKKYIVEDSLATLQSECHSISKDFNLTKNSQLLSAAKYHKESRDNNNCNTVEEDNELNLMEDLLSPLSSLYSENSENTNCDSVEENEELDLIQELQILPRSTSYLENTDDGAVILKNSKDSLEKNEILDLPQEIQTSPKSPSENIDLNLQAGFIKIIKGKVEINEKRSIHDSETSAQYKCHATNKKEDCVKESQISVPPMPPLSSIYNKNLENDDCEIIDEKEELESSSRSKPHNSKQDPHILSSKFLSKNIEIYYCDSLDEDEELTLTQDFQNIPTSKMNRKKLRENEELNLQQNMQISKKRTVLDANLVYKDVLDEHEELNLAHDSQTTLPPKRRRKNIERYGCAVPVESIDLNEQRNLPQSLHIPLSPKQIHRKIACIEKNTTVSKKNIVSNRDDQNLTPESQTRVPLKRCRKIIERYGCVVPVDSIFVDSCNSLQSNGEDIENDDSDTSEEDDELYLPRELPTSPSFKYRNGDNLVHTEAVNQYLNLAGGSQMSAPPKLHRCPVCEKKFTSLELRKHCQIHHFSLKKYIRYAPKFNKNVRFYAKPVKKKVLWNEEAEFTCPFCNETFNGLTFQDHAKAHEDQGNFRCNTCNRNFLKITHLKMHQLSHKKENTYTCEECGTGFSKKQGFEAHKLAHTGDPKYMKYQCLICPSRFHNYDAFKKHRFKHEHGVSQSAFYAQKKWKCLDCGQIFQKQEDLTRHTCSFACAKCHEIFPKKEFQKHTCTVKNKCLACKDCGKAFRLPSSFKMHSYICQSAKTSNPSQGEKCHICNEELIGADAIQKHKQMHILKRRYGCTECEKKFTEASSLSEHIRMTHQNKEIYRCKLCDQKFTTKWKCDVHKRIHKGKHFAESRNLLRQLEKMHAERKNIGNSKKCFKSVTDNVKGRSTQLQKDSSGGVSSNFLDVDTIIVID